MKNLKTLAMAYYGVAVLWFAIAITYYRDVEKKTLGTTYFAIAVVWLALGGMYAQYGKRGKKTLEYYNTNAKAYAEATENADMSEARTRFLKYVPAGGKLLDWGCGSGRDTIAFKEAGYDVDAIDGSEELCKIASEKTGQEVHCQSFDELKSEQVYDGIWACASLLHVSKDYIPQTVQLARKALKPNGVMYMSFKLGDKDEERDGRFFTDMTAEKFAKIMKHNNKIEVLEQWTSGDVRDGRQNEQWFNVIIRSVTFR